LLSPATALIKVHGNALQTGNKDTFITVAESSPLAFSSPSAIAIGQPPMFSGYEVLLTEKGLMFDNASSFGNRLSAAQMAFNLNDKEACDFVELFDK